MRRERVALEPCEIFAPLATRLGAGEFKWQLEDFALRYLEPEEYHRIARALQEKRADRERRIERLQWAVCTWLVDAEVNAEVDGRAKPICSIHRKMHRKDLPLEKVFDVCALRMIVGTYGTVVRRRPALKTQRGLRPPQ